MIVGICGKSGSGKSELTKALLNKYSDARVINIDEIGHRALKDEKVKELLRENFGSEIFNDGEVNRKALSRIVFNDKKEMDKLTLCTWDYMQQEIDKLLDKDVIIFDWQLLPLSKYFEMCDYKILLDIPYGIRKERIINRDGISEEEFDLREKASFTYNKDDFDFVLKDNVIDWLIKKI